MTSYSLTFLLIALSCAVLLTDAARQPRPWQRCGATHFSCTNNDPCAPRCVAGQDLYAGPGPQVYITCVGGCAEHKCPPRSTWDLGSQRCEADNGNILRCAASKYNCTNRNPCSPTLCEAGVFNYPGTKAKKYVHCNGSGGCAVLKCPRRQIWNQGTQSCQPKNA